MQYDNGWFGQVQDMNLYILIIIIKITIIIIRGYGLWCLTPLSAIFQLYYDENNNNNHHHINNDDKNNQYSF